MTTILNIDTTGSEAFVAVAQDGIVRDVAYSINQKDHASFLHPAIEAQLLKLNLLPSQINAVAVTDGPGSYTGIRIGLSAAKGLCYALNVPLICVSSLKLLAAAAAERTGVKSGVIVPMIDARRMEVFTAVYSPTVKEIELPHALLLNSESFNIYLSNGKVFFCGSGVEKFRGICEHKNAHFVDTMHVSTDLCRLSFLKFKQGEVSDLITSNPRYVKEFYNFK